MNIRQTVRIPRRVLSLALCAAMVLTLLPLPTQAEGICGHHPEHTADCGYKAAVEGQDCAHSHNSLCGYQEASPCSHSHDESCGYREASACAHRHTEECGENGESCTHQHDEACGYQEASPCTHSHDESCGYREARDCTHAHDDTCGYVEAVTGSPCTYRCEICAQQASQQQNGQERCTHGNESAACETCASEKKVTEVQALINALPETVTEETREAAQSALSAVEEAKAALTEAEQEKLDLTRCTALKALLAEPEAVDTGKVLTDWEWVDDFEIIDPKTGLAHLPFASAENIAYYDAVIEVLPAAITANEEELTLGDWLCEDYPMESGACEGEYVFETTLPEGYVLADGTNVLRLTVVLGDPEGENVAWYSDTPSVGYYDIGIDQDVEAYELKDADDLYWFSDQINSGNNEINAVLINDIVVNKNVLDANGEPTGSNFRDWTPIGTSLKPYSGKFDGRGHTVSGLYVNASNRVDSTGFFGVIQGAARIYRVGVEDSYFNGNENVGGFCGKAYDSTTIKNCYTTATVRGDAYVGGFCGFADTPTVDSCFCTGNVSANVEDKFGLFYHISRKNATNCYVLDKEEKTDIFDVAHKTAAQFASGEVAYWLSSPYIGESSTWRQTIGTHSLPQLTTKGAIVYCGLKDGQNYYHNHSGGEVCKYCVPTQNTDGSYYIKTKEQLYWFASLVNGTNGMTATPNAKASILESITVDSDWVPIGNNTTFTGGIASSYNRTISGIPAGSSLVGTIGSGVTVEKLTIPSGSLCTGNLGTIKSCTASGNALVSGSNSGTITDCTASGSALVSGNNSGTIRDCTASGGKLVGGNNNSGGTVTDCSVTGTGSVALIGGSNSGTIAKSYAKGGTGASLCQTNNSGGKITNCYATATSGSAKLCGSNSGTIANCYAKGGSGTVLCDSGTATNCYVKAGDNESAVGGESITSGDFRNGKVAYLLNKGATGYPGGVWGQTIDTETLPLLGSKTVYYTENGNRGYHNHNGYCTDCKKLPTYENRVWQIKDADDLYWFAQYVNGDFELPNDLNGATYDAQLMNDITVNSGVLKPDGSLSDNSAGFAQWTPIGNLSNQYKGTFDGNNHTISGLYVNTPETNQVGLFGCIYTATLKDLTIADSYLCGGMETGAVCGWIQQGSTVSNCHNTGTVVGTDYVGGVAGSCGGTSDNSTTITDCSNSGNVSGNGCVGGVCGLAEESTTISNCTNSGDVRGSSSGVGGVCGDCGRSNRTGTATVSNCTNSGMVSGSYQVGGVCGEVYTNGTVSNCANSGKVSGGSSGCIGGVCGNNKGSVESCYNTGEVSGSRDVGGVCGTISSSGTITNCYYNIDKYDGNAIGSSEGTVNTVEGKNTKAFASGEVAYLLNGSTDNGTWKQNIDVGTPDATPNFTSNTVYKTAESSECPGYTNDSAYSGASRSHNYVKHICTRCGATNATAVTVTGITAKNKTYDGSVEAQLNTTNMTLSNVQAGHTVTVSAAGVFDNANVGTDKTVTITLTLGGANKDEYYLSSKTITAKAAISAKPVTAVVTVAPKTYDGTTTATVTAAVTEGLASGDSITITGLTGTFDDANVGTGKTVTVNAAGKSITGTGATNYDVTIPDTATGTITKAQAVITVEEGKTAYSKTYGDAPFQLTGITENSNDAEGVQYAVTAGTDVVTVSGSGQVTILKAGTATVTLSLPESSNYLAAQDKTIRIDVAKMAGAVNITGKLGKTYDGQPAALTEAMFSVTNDGGRTPSVEYKKQTADDSAYIGTAPTNAGDYTVRVTLEETDNYGLVTKTEGFTISPKPVTVSGITAENKTYDGNTTATLNYDGVTFTGKLDEDILTVEATGEFESANAAENKTVTISGLTLGGASKDNYVLATDGQQATATATITKANASVTKAPEDAKSLYSGLDVPLVTEGTAQGGTMMYRLGEDGSWTERLPQAAAHGEYTVYYYVKGDGNHEDTAQQSLKARIRPFEIAAQPQTESVNYGDSKTLAVILNPKATDVSGITYQWCLVTVEDGREVYTPLEGETGSSLTLTKPNAGTYVYGCVITCGEDYSVTSDKATVTVTAVQKDLTSTSDLPSGLWVEGGEEPLVGDSIDLKSPSSFLLTGYTYNGASADAHQNYPTGMEVYSVGTDDQGQTTVAPVAELGNLLRYSGCSIRITGKPGIRMITSLTKEAKEALKKGELAGYTLEEYGTVAVWSSDLGNQPLTLKTEKARNNYAYKKGVSDPVFANVGNLTQYTNVLVWDSLEDQKYDEDIVMRPYIKLSNKAGETVVLYGGTVSRSIGYVAQQNANTFSKGTAGYKYVHEIIDKVNALHSSTETNTTGG